jgi:transposase
VRQTTALTQLGLALGGCGGARQAVRQGMPTSRNTVLRLVRRIPPPPEPAPIVIGIDDWAQRKGQMYASIVVDLERHQPITLLSDRSAQTMEAWLQAHPTVTIISRDRSTTYAAASTAGAPSAIQVADRFHILKNLREAVEQELARRGIVLQRSAPDTAAPAAPDAVGQVRSTNDGGTSGVAAPQPPPALATAQNAQLPTSPIYPTTPSGRRAEAARQARRAERLAQYTQMVELQQQGLDQGSIVRTIGVSPRTVSRWSARGQFPERKRRTGDTSGLEPYKAYLLEHWHAGCHTIAHLWRDVQTRVLRDPISWSTIILHPCGVARAFDYQQWNRSCQKIWRPKRHPIRPANCPFCCFVEQRS